MENKAHFPNAASSSDTGEIQAVTVSSCQSGVKYKTKFGVDHLSQFSGPSHVRLGPPVIKRICLATPRSTLEVIPYACWLPKSAIGVRQYWRKTVRSPG